MPELPDVEIFSRLVRNHCRGHVIAKATIFDPGIIEGISGRALDQRLRGRRIEASRRHGKYLFIELDGGSAIAMHFGTNGSLRFTVEGEADPPYTRLRLNFSRGAGLAYLNPRRIGRVSLCENSDAFIAHLNLGPDALDSAFDLRAFSAILKESKRGIKVVLMDQNLIAGIGNIYSDEILFQARINPDTPANRLDSKRVTHLFSAMHDTLETAILCGAGSEQGAERLPKGFLIPQRRKGGHCPRCGTALATAKTGGRSSYFCPQCQPR